MSTNLAGIKLTGKIFFGCGGTEVTQLEITLAVDQVVLTLDGV